MPHVRSRARSRDQSGNGHRSVEILDIQIRVLIEAMMTTGVYNVVGTPEGWIKEHDEDRSPPYEFPEAAFEAAVAAASLTIKTRMNVVVSLSFASKVPGAMDPGRSLNSAWPRCL
jgi:hypothetical protein